MSQDEISQVLEALQKQIHELSNENTKLRGHLEENESAHTQVTNEYDYLTKKYNTISQEISTYRNTQARMENQIYNLDQDLVAARKEAQSLTKAKKDAEKKLTVEMENFENDRVKWQQREADLYNQIRSISAANGDPRTPRRRSITANSLGAGSLQQYGSSLGNISEVSPTPSMSTPHANGSVGEIGTPKLAVIDSSFAREAKIASRTIKAQDKLISDLKAEVEKQKNAVQENVSQLQLQSLKMKHLEHEITNVKQLNRSLMEDNESYQMLLHEKTMNGEIMLNSFMQSSDASNKEKEIGHQDVQPQPSQSTTTGLNLAAELNMASGPTGWETNEREQDEKDANIKKLNEEVKTLQDTNRALQLYMNKILMKIVTDKQLLDVLSIDAPKPKTPEPEPKALPKVSGPMPSKTTSTGYTGKSSDNRAQRRRTISYWGSRASNPAVAALAEVEEKANDNVSKADTSIPIAEPIAAEKNLRRHSTLSEKANGNAGSWAKTLRRMTVMGWSNNPAKPDSSEDWSDKEQDASSLQVSRSGSSSPSLRRSGERDSLGTLEEE
ncbi:hypothetical protein K450DRAFT_255610 [Umbelopsis ramanniana AG]|uniref:Uncharacterized protein n=1 Tax=Umbelopsis ramanniana AG TaxID=1314678 RepID=A0AAD5HBB9_UMBRA|nr:uncharacterized protein K450DRAFT_255610 [Umbelopsis ramanniana AG]KAI8576674.1 hypothetical protein K450DRAFT_255610 [Umbelopsis ramanniana AG]